MVASKKNTRSQSTTAKKTTGRGKAATSQASAKSKQATLSFAPSGTGARSRGTRTAATAARGKMQKVVRRHRFFSSEPLTQMLSMFRLKLIVIATNEVWFRVKLFPRTGRLCTSCTPNCVPGPHLHLFSTRIHSIPSHYPLCQSFA